MKKTLHLLLADDDKDDRFFFKEALKQLPDGHKLITVEDGEKLLNFLTETKQLPDLLFLDLNMPRKNGGECLCEIKSDKRLRAIPVIIYSTYLHDEVANVLYTDGAHYYLRKDDITELPKAISQIITLLNKDPKQPPRNEFVISLQEV